MNETIRLTESIEQKREMVGEQIGNYEKSGKILPLVYKKNEDPLALKARKNSGMHQFLYELTSFASGGFNFEKYKNYTEIRVGNGRLFEIDKKKQRK